MFDPKFNYTHQLVDVLSQISAADAIINNTNLFKSYDLLFKDSAMVKTAYHSISIAGNPLTIKQVNQLFNGEEVQASEVGVWEVLNYFTVIEKLDKFHEAGLNEDTLGEINRYLTTGTLKNPALSGNYKNSQLKVAMHEFFTWLRNENYLHPVLTAAIAHHAILNKLPFSKGNGKTARVMVHLIFKQKQFNCRGYYQLDEEFHENITAYKEAVLKSTETEDMTNWLEYFAGVVLVSILRTKKYVLDIYREKCIPHNMNQLPISPNEIKIFQFLRVHKRIRSQDIQRMFGVSHPGVFKYIQKLLDYGVIKPLGRGRNTYYVFKH
ncbi:filamentation induced by cAMP protein Fic [Methanobacterium lacus]|uniref:Filamentation induced by cAMP protein Fic n=1 Tax=Methanobacterium lacus (strain AL-21) TaxID=877455 RepID=F0T8Z8_METLA|nr:Fic family protein [Methanobacterium lacus]ADZ09826.1 filamentation induced by cAMP protein Fic [Methanobacterium lacus]